MNKDFKFSQHRFNCLATEAQAVLSETGLTPRQLAEQRAELLKALRGFIALNPDFSVENASDSWLDEMIAV